MFDTRNHFRAAALFAAAATSDDPASVNKLSDGLLEMANAAAAADDYGTFLGLLRSAVERQPGDWAVVAADVRHAANIAEHGSGLFVGLCRANQRPVAIMGPCSYYAGIRLFRFQTFTGESNNCSLVPLASEDEWGQRMAVVLNDHATSRFDEPLLAELKLIVAAALAVLTELATDLDNNPHLVRHLAALSRLVPSIDDAPSDLAESLDSSRGLDRAMTLVSLTALAMGRRPWEILALAERRVSDMMPTDGQLD